MSGVYGAARQGGLAAVRGRLVSCPARHLPQVLPEEGQRSLPGVIGDLFSVGGVGVVEEGVGRSTVDVGLVGHAVLLEGLA